MNSNPFSNPLRWLTIAAGVAAVSFVLAFLLLSPSKINPTPEEDRNSVKLEVAGWAHNKGDSTGYSFFMEIDGQDPVVEPMTLLFPNVYVAKAKMPEVVVKPNIPFNVSFAMTSPSPEKAWISGSELLIRMNPRYEVKVNDLKAQSFEKTPHTTLISDTSDQSDSSWHASNFLATFGYPDQKDRLWSESNFTTSLEYDEKKGGYYGLLKISNGRFAGQTKQSVLSAYLYSLGDYEMKDPPPSTLSYLSRIFETDRPDLLIFSCTVTLLPDPHPAPLSKPDPFSTPTAETPLPEAGRDWGYIFTAFTVILLTSIVVFSQMQKSS